MSKIDRRKKDITWNVTDDDGNAALCDAAGEPLVNQISFTLDNPAFGQARATVEFRVDGEQIRFK